MKSVYPAVACAAFVALSAQAQLFNFTTVAGSAARGNLDGATNLCQFNNPGGVAMDPSGNIYVADTADDTIRKISPGGVVSTFAGSPGVIGSADGTGTNALFNEPQSLAVDSSGNIYVADSGNFTIREITPGGSVSTLAGLAGVSGSGDGTGTNALFYEPEGIAVDAADNVFVADTWNQTIREISPAGVVKTIAGSPGSFGSTDLGGTNALFYEPAGIAVDASDDVFVADSGNNTIRKIAPDGTVTTLAGWPGGLGYINATGTNALFDSPRGIALDSSGDLFVADYLNNAIREVTSAGVVTTIAGDPGSMGSADGVGTNALFRGLQGVVVNPTNDGVIYVADSGNSTIRRLTDAGPNWIVSTLAGNASIGSADASGTAARFFWPMDIAADGQGNVYVADAANDVVRKIASDGTVSTIAGSPGVAGSSDGSGPHALFNAPQGIATDSSGNVYVADTGNSTIRKITSGGTVSTLAGSAGNPGSADGTGTNALFDEPEGIGVEGGTNIFVADTLNHTIREITSDGVVTTFAGTAGDFGTTDGTNSAAQFNRPAGLALDGSGDLFVTDLGNHTIRKITPAGVVSTVAGLPGVLGSADGTNCGARFCEPEGIAVDGAGNVYVADAGNQTVRELTPMGTDWVVTTIAGWAGNDGSSDGSGIGARFCYPAGMTMSAGNLVLADSGNNTIRSGSEITDNPPRISGQPQGQAVDAGSPVTFNVSATGGTLYYQWLFDGATIPGATGASYTLGAAGIADAGSYSVLVTSPTGSVVSSNAILTVYSQPVITNQPASQGCLAGATVAFSVVAGPTPLTYQWEKNGQPLSDSGSISGSATATLTLSGVTTADSGSYSVLVENGYGDVTSSNALLTVFFVPPADSIQPVARWLLNEGAGTTVYDYSGNGHNGTLSAGTSWTNGYSGSGVYFNGTNGDIAISGTFNINANWTATMWVNRWGTKDSSVLLGGSSDALKLEQHDDGSQVGYTVYGIADYPMGYVTPLNTWTHLAYVETSAGVSLYVNGVFVSSATHTAALNATTIGFGLPAATTDYLDATLNDVRVYNQALTQQQIANIYAYGRISPIPFITLTVPTNGANFTVSTNITMAANVVSNGLAVAGVQFYAGTNLLGETTTAPYAWTWTNVSAGDYSLTAAALYNGTTNASAPVGISVTPATTQATITLSQSANALQLSWPADHTGWRLEMQTNDNAVGLSTNWITVTNSMTTNEMVVPVGNGRGSAFYRLVYP